MSKANPIISKDIEVNKLAKALNRVVVDKGVPKTLSPGYQIRPTRRFKQLKKLSCTFKSIYVNYCISLIVIQNN